MGLAHFVEVKRSRWVGLMCGLESRSFLSITAGSDFTAAERRRTYWAVTAAEEGKRGCVILFPPSLLWKNKTLGISLCMVYPLMLWCVSDSGWIFCSVAIEESFVHPRIHPVSFLYASFSSRWDEFGQNRRGSESAAAPRRGRRVSFTENFKQQPRNFRELKQRVFRHRVGRYTERF